MEAAALRRQLNGVKIYEVRRIADEFLAREVVNASGALGRVEMFKDIATFDVGTGGPFATTQRRRPRPPGA